MALIIAKLGLSRTTLQMCTNLIRQQEIDILGKLGSKKKLNIAQSFEMVLHEIDNPFNEKKPSANCCHDLKNRHVVFLML